MTLLASKHEQYVFALSNEKAEQQKLSFWMSSHLRLSGVYWGLSALALLKTQQPEAEREKMIAFTLACQNADGGFGGNVGHDSHLLYTLSACQVLAILGAEGRLTAEQKERAAAWVAALQQPDGSFVGDRWGEVDTRFSYSALNALTLLGHIDKISVDKAVEFIVRCQNWDAGFGVVPQAESHAGQVFCCVGALSIVDRLDAIDVERVAWWLAERQLPSGGLNGRPEKKADVCYSWWVLASLEILNKRSWIDKDALVRFILLCQDADDGGVADKPGNQPDVYHTYFGIAGLSLLQWVEDPAKPDALAAICPSFALPVHVVKRLGLPARGLQNKRQQEKQAE